MAQAQPLTASITWNEDVNTTTGAANSVPSTATDGVAVNGSRGQVAHIAVETTVSAGTVTSSPAVYGYSSKLGFWMRITTITDVASTASENTVTRIEDLAAFDRITVIQDDAIGGTGSVTLHIGLS